VKCWSCGVEPVELHDVQTLGDPEPVYLPIWPHGGDHEHAERPPTPGELEQAGHEALRRIQMGG
jgi:hypothetical protein